MAQNKTGQRFSRPISQPLMPDKRNQPRPTPPTVSIIVRCKGRLKSLKQTLKFSMMQTYPLLEIIVVNYNSPDKLHDWLEEEFSNFISIGKLIEVYVPETLYFDHAHSRNVGLKHALGDWVLYLDAEVQPNTKLVHYFVDRLSNIMDIFGCFGPNCPPDAAGTLFAKRDDLIALGGFMENLEGWGYEDGDMRDRLYLLGREMFCISGSMVQALTHPNRERCMYFKPPLNRQELENAGKWLEDNKAKNYQTSKEYIAKHGYRANQGKEWGQDGYIVGSGQRWLEQLKRKSIEQLNAELYHGARHTYVLKWDRETGRLLNEKELLAMGCPTSYIEKAKESYRDKRQAESRGGTKPTMIMNRAAVPGTLPETVSHTIPMKLPTKVDIPEEKSDDMMVEIPELEVPGGDS